VKSQRRNSARRGSALIEFIFVTIMLMLVIFASIEFDRMALVYTTVANAARVGARYAIVHGSDRTGTGDPASGPSDYSAVVTVVKNFASAGLLSTSALDVSVTYSTDNKPGSQVVVSVTYPYDPFTSVLPLSVNIHSTSRGVIVF
jgi:Flp pilus assembly protein TadG